MTRVIELPDFRELRFFDAFEVGFTNQPVDEFADLNNLTGADLEAAIAKMPPERQEKWLKAS